MTEYPHLHSIVQYKQLLARILHDIATEMSHEVCNICRLAQFVFGRQREIVLFLVGKENLESSAAGSQYMAARKACIWECT